MVHHITILVLSLLTLTTVAAMRDLDIPEPMAIHIPKCCNREFVIHDRDGTCQHINETGTTEWKPKFTTEDGKEPQNIPSYNIIIGKPNCERHQHWPIYYYVGSTDRLLLLPSGKLRHYARDKDLLESAYTSSSYLDLEVREHEAHPEEPRFYDYMPMEYCLDKVILDDGREAIFASVCTPKPNSDWTYTDFLIFRVVDPMCHVISVICLLATAIVYFVLPQLRDLVGNIITTITICLLVAQAADLVRTFTEFGNHVSFLVADLVLYTALMAAFFWINSMGYYVHRHFKSSNVFLRSTDGRKYCYYSCYVWGSTITLGLIALFAHVMFESGENSNTTPMCAGNQRNVGWLGIAVFFVPVAVLVIINIFFWRSTALTMSRISSFGRIHNKLRYSFQMFVKLFLVMTAAWFFFMLTWIQSRVLCYINICINILQAVLFLYICVLSQKRVTFQLRKTCCYENCICPCCRPGEPTPETCEWGEEMHYFDTLDNFN